MRDRAAISNRLYPTAQGSYIKEVDGIVLPVHFVAHLVTPHSSRPVPRLSLLRVALGQSTMAYRRRRTFRRKPVRRVRRRRYHRRRYRRRTGNLLVKLSKVASYTVDQTKNNVWDASFRMSDFPEHESLARNFESLKLLKVRVTVIPLQNVANNSTSVMHQYVMCPWHYPIAAPATFNAYLSSDKAKLFRGTQIGSQSYVPSMMLVNQLNSKQQPNVQVQDTIVWRPTIRTITTSEPANISPLIWTGIIAWQGDPSTGAQKAHFNIKMDVWVKYNNQTNMLV